MSDPMKTRAEVAEKIEWEGGYGAALEYGLKVDDMPEGDNVLRAAWGRLDMAQKVWDRCADAVDLLLQHPENWTDGQT